MKTCFFIGHRDAPYEIMPVLYEAIQRHITEYGVTHFVVGYYGNFDSMAAQAVSEAKRMHNISLHLLLPYHPSERLITPPDGFDGTLYVLDYPVPKRLAIVKSNRLMIDRSDFLIAYVNGPGNSRSFLEYAAKRESEGLVQIENLSNN